MHLFALNWIMKASGFSIIELFGVVALALTLAVVAIPSIKSFSEGVKQGAAVRNASFLNSAVQQSALRLKLYYYRSSSGGKA